MLRPQCSQCHEYFIYVEAYSHRVRVIARSQSELFVGNIVFLPGVNLKGALEAREGTFVVEVLGSSSCQDTKAQKPPGTVALVARRSSLRLAFILCALLRLMESCSELQVQDLIGCVWTVLSHLHPVPST